MCHEHEPSMPLALNCGQSVVQQLHFEKTKCLCILPLVYVQIIVATIIINVEKI